MPTYYRRDDDVQNGLGEAVPNISVAYYLQPGLTLAAVYSTATGTSAANPQITNGLGQTVAYLASGYYTVTYSGAQIQTLTYADQQVGPGVAGLGAPVTPTPAADGVTRIFVLGFTPVTPTAGQLFVAGSYVPYGVYTISGPTLTWVGAVPPQSGDTMEYFGQ